MKQIKEYLIENRIVVLFLVMVFLKLGFLSAQSPRYLIDSLKTVYLTTEKDSVKAMTLCHLGYVIYKMDADSALTYLSQGLALAKSSGYEYAEAQCYLNLGIVHWARGDYKASLENYDLAIQRFEQTGEVTSLIKALINLGYCNYSLGEFDEALKYYFQAKDLVNLKEDTLMYAGILNNVGMIYEKKGKHVQALENYQVSLHLKMESSDPNAKAYQSSTLGAIGSIYQFMKDYDLARDYFLRALKISRDLDYKIGIIVYTYNLGVNHQKEKNFESAQSLLLKALEEAQSYGNQTYIAYCYNSLGEVKLELKKNTEARELLLKALEIRRGGADKNALTVSLASCAQLAYSQENDKELKDYLEEFFSMQNYANLEDQEICSGLFSKLKQKKGKFREAIEYFKMAKLLGDSLTNIAKESELERLKLKFDDELAQKSQKMELLTKDKAIASLNAKNQYISIIGLILGLLIVSVLAITLFRIGQKRRETHQQLAVNNEMLSQSKYQLERANMQFEKVNLELEIANNSLQQFAFAASHDLKESLRSVTSFSQLLRQNIEAGAVEIQLDKYVNYIVNSSKRMRKTLNDLLQYSNIPIDKTGPEKINLIAIIRSLEIEMVNKELLPKNHFLSISEFPTVYAEQNLIYQLFFNLLDNAGKFRNEDRILNLEIGTTTNNEKSNVFFIRDNGIGIEPAYLNYIFEPFHRLDNMEKQGAGLGLAVVKKIVKNYGGEIWAESKIDHGLTIYFTLPKAISQPHPEI
ncbi:MAG: hypothetical protein DHS20C18_12860 [Saprospiraceae bacterium]|nr:MAG: hypothetical protein DHS20C18_12860 [Saprospiraceae bacterium]